MQINFFKKTSPPLQLVYFFGLFFIFSTLFYIGSTAVTSLVYGISVLEIPALLEGNVSLQAIFQLFSQLFMFGFPALFFILIFWGNFKQTLWNQKIKNILCLLIAGILFFIASFPFLNMLQSWNEGITFPESFSKFEIYWRNIETQNEKVIEQFLLNSSWIAFFRNILIMAIVPAICEELFFRGVLQQIFLSLIKRKHLAIIFTAIIFTTFHFEPFAFVPRLLLALLLGYLFFYSKNLWVSAFFHFLNNIIIVVFYFLYSKNVIHINPNGTIDIHWLISLLSFLATACLVFFLFFYLLNPEKNILKKQRTT